MDIDVDVAVVGGGAVGLASAAALAVAGRSVVLLERHDGFGRECTARNSEVIHAGIYYPAESLKAELCVTGRRRLYQRCEAERIPYRKLGKLIVASRSDEIETLEQLQTRGVRNGVEGLELIDAEAVRRREPDVRACAALWSPETGIIDGQALCLSYAAEAEAHGALLIRHSLVRGIEAIAGGYALDVLGGDGDHSILCCAAVVNAAGLESDRLAATAGFDIAACGYQLRYCKGDYFGLAPGAPIRLSGLVYPVPSGAGLGVHATLDLAGRVRFGPDSEYVAEIGYEVDPLKAGAFAAAIRCYLPAIEAAWLSPDYAGVRPKLAGPGEALRDFVVREETAAGFPAFVNLIGIESPGLTASPAIGDRVVSLLRSL